MFMHFECETPSYRKLWQGWKFKFCTRQRCIVILWALVKISLGLLIDDWQLIWKKILVFLNQDKPTQSVRISSNIPSGSWIQVFRVLLNVNFIDMTLHKSMCFLSFASHVKVYVRNLIFLCHFYLATPIFQIYSIQFLLGFLTTWNSSYS